MDVGRFSCGLDGGPDEASEVEDGVPRKGQALEAYPSGQDREKNWPVLLFVVVSFGVFKGGFCRFEGC